MNDDGSAIDPDTAWKDPPGLGRSIVVGIAAGIVLSFAVVCLMVLVDGQALGAALGLGLFIAVWGGIGFGAMVGGVVFASRLEKEAHPQR